MKHVALLAMVIGSLSMAAGATTILSPVAAGAAYGGGGYQPAQNNFDAQPTWDAVNGVPVGGEDLGNDAAYYSDRWAYIDLGEDWADWRIEELWTLYRTWSGGAQPAWIEAQWAAVDPSVYPGAVGDPGNIAEPSINFNYYPNLSNIGTQQWAQNLDTTASPITPQSQWLILKTDATSTYNRGREWAFAGYIVPEPATMGLLAIGGLAALIRRKR